MTESSGVDVTGSRGVDGAGVERTGVDGTGVDGTGVDGAGADGAESGAAAVTVLRVGGRSVADYVTSPQIDPLRGPRPYLHPVRTLAGTVVTDVLPEDHPHHLGVSVSMQDVNGNNLWGGRTYVRDAGYTWLDDHGSIEHVEWLARADGRVEHRLRWLGADGATLLDEHRVITASAVPGDPDAWRLDIAYTLTNPNPTPVTFGSPATNGRPGKAGYGGFFWRAASGVPRVFDPHTDVEADVNGSTAPWVALVGAGPRGPYTLIFEGLGQGDHWFVRATEYPGVCVALAFERPRVLAHQQSLAREHRILVCDGERRPPFPSR